MTPEENIQLAKQGYADFQRGNIQAILAILDDHVVWTTPNIGVPPGGTYTGKTGVAQFFQHVQDAWDFQAFEPKQYIASGDQVAVLGSYTAIGKATGRQVTSEWAMVWTIRDGKLTHFQEYTDSAALRDALTVRAAAG